MKVILTIALIPAMSFAACPCAQGVPSDQISIQRACQCCPETALQTPACDANLENPISIATISKSVSVPSLDFPNDSIRTMVPSVKFSSKTFDSPPSDFNVPLYLATRILRL